MTYDWYNSFSFELAPGTGTGGTDVHNINVEIYTATRYAMGCIWFHLVPGNTDLWDVTLSMEDWNHGHTSNIVTDDPGPPYGGSGSGSDGPYERCRGVGHYNVPSWARVGPGLHTFEFNEVAGDFFVNFDGAWYDLSPAQTDPSYSTPAVCYHMTEGAWYKAPSCWPVYSPGCDTTGNPHKPQSSLAVVYGDGSGATADWEGMAAYGNPVLSSANSLVLLSFPQTGLYVDIEAKSFDPRGVFWTRFHQSFET